MRILSAAARDWDFSNIFKLQKTPSVSSSLLGHSKSDKVVFKVGSSLLRVTRIVKDCPSIAYSEEKENVIW